MSFSAVDLSGLSDGSSDLRYIRGSTQLHDGLSQASAERSTKVEQKRQSQQQHQRTQALQRSSRKPLSIIAILSYLTSLSEIGVLPYDCLNYHFVSSNF